MNNRLVFHLQIETPAERWRYLRFGYWNASIAPEESLRVVNGANDSLTDSLDEAHTWYQRGAFTSFDRVARCLVIHFAVRRVASRGGDIIEQTPIVPAKT